VPFVGVVGDREVHTGGVSLRAAGEDRGMLARAALVELLREACRPPAV
jgi:hypothetical protein